MPTTFQHRLIVIVPQARYAALFAWWQANVDAADDGSGWPKLNASGLAADAETHRWCSTALVDSDLKAVLAKVCQLAAVAAPTNAQWTGWTRQQKQQWLAGVRASLLSATGIYLDLSDNDGAWDDAEAVLAVRSIRRRVAAATQSL